MQAFAETFAHLLTATESAEFHPYHATARKTGAGSSLLTLQATFALADVVRKTQDKQADKEEGHTLRCPWSGRRDSNPQ